MGAKQTKRQFFVQQSGSRKSRLAERRGRTDDLVQIAQPQFASASVLSHAHWGHGRVWAGTGGEDYSFRR
jgi:hypothetical protein